MTTPDLDDPALYSLRDPGGMGHILRMSPDLFRQGWETAAQVSLPTSYRSAARIVFLGMGGSSMAGELADRLIREHSALPTMLHRDYGIPPSVDSATLVIASSYSGDTEETLSGVRAAIARGAMIVAFTHGGILARLAKHQRLPWVPILADAPPRTTTPYTLAGILSVLRRLSIAQLPDTDVHRLQSLLTDIGKALDTNSPVSSNQAKVLASSLVGHIPVIYGAESLIPVAHRWRTQFNENAKAWAFSDELPEAHHNSIAGYEFPGDLRQRMYVIFLEPPSASRRVLLRFDLTKAILDDLRIPNEVVHPVGESRLSNVLSLMMLGDYVSYYLAILNGTDPTTLPVVENVKRHLRQPRY